MSLRVRFRSGHASVDLPAECELSEHLTAENSPVLFGCRTGICGTCLSRVEACGSEPLPEPGSEERELTSLLRPEEPRARLLCQLRARGEILIEPLEA